MGYYTTYELTANPWPDDLEINEEEYFGLNSDGSTSDSCKWYNHEEDMRKLSLQFPQVHFTLHGKGEESGDIWNKHFLGGKMQLCKAIITFSPFDESKLE